MQRCHVTTTKYKCSQHRRLFGSRKNGRRQESSSLRSHTFVSAGGAWASRVSSQRYDDAGNELYTLCSPCWLLCWYIISRMCMKITCPFVTGHFQHSVQSRGWSTIALLCSWGTTLVIEPSLQTLWTRSTTTKTFSGARALWCVGLFKWTT